MSFHLIKEKLTEDQKNALANVMITEIYSKGELYQMKEK